MVPANRRSRLRGDFAFGFVAHLSFFDGLIGPDAELAIHDYMENALRTEPAATHVFIVETAHPFADAGMALSAYLEKLSMAMLHWLREKDRECVRTPRRRPRLHAGSRAA